MKIVILEDNAERRLAMDACLRDRFHQYERRFFETPQAAIEYLRNHLNEALLISLDHDMELLPDGNGGWMDPGTGRQVSDYMAGRRPSCPVIIHTSNVSAAAGMQSTLDDAGWRTHVVAPYDDLAWIPEAWYRTVRRAIVDSAQVVEQTDAAAST